MSSNDSEVRQLQAKVDALQKTVDHLKAILRSCENDYKCWLAHAQGTVASLFKALRTVAFKAVPDTTGWHLDCVYCESTHSDHYGECIVKKALSKLGAFDYELHVRELEREACILDFKQASDTAPDFMPQREVFRVGADAAKARGIQFHEAGEALRSPAPMNVDDRIINLWHLLDDIDTLDAHADDARSFREGVRAVLRKRSSVFKPEGK